MRVKIRTERNGLISEHTVEVGDQPRTIDLLIENSGGGFTFLTQQGVSTKDVRG